MTEKCKELCVREQEIIEAAQRVFAEFGYKKVTMDDVAARLNITRSALYYYYKSKEELFVAVGEFEFRNYESLLRKAVDSGQTTDERFVAFCKCFLPMRKKFRDIYKLANDDFNFSMKAHRKFKSIISSIHRAMFVDIFKKDRNISAAGNLEHYASLLTYSIRGIVFSSDELTIEQLENDILGVCRIFCSGISGLRNTKKDSGRKD